MIIAQTILYRKRRGIVQRIRIAISLPEPDPHPGGDFRCRVAVSGEKPRHVYGIDSFQALNLAFVLIRSVVTGWLVRRHVLFMDRRLRYRYDPHLVRLVFLNDASSYEQLGETMMKRGDHA